MSMDLRNKFISRMTNVVIHIHLPNYRCHGWSLDIFRDAFDPFLTNSITSNNMNYKPTCFEGYDV